MGQKHKARNQQSNNKSSADMQIFVLTQILYHHFLKRKKITTTKNLGSSNQVNK